MKNNLFSAIFKVELIFYIRIDLGIGLGARLGASQRNRGDTGGPEVILCMRSAALGGIEKMFVYIRVVNQKVTLGPWVGPETLLVRKRIGASRGAGRHPVRAIGWIQERGPLRGLTNWVLDLSKGVPFVGLKSCLFI